MARMQPVRRRALTCLLFLGALLLILTLAASSWLALWIPSHGARWLEQTLEQRLPVDATIRRLRYTPWDGLTVEELSATDRQTALPVCRATHIKARIGLLPLLLQRQVAFHVTAALSVPAETRLTVSGRYDPRSGRGAIDLLTSDLLVSRIAPEMARRFPDLTEGTLRLKCSVSWHPNADLAVSGRLVGTAVAWQRGALRVTGDVIVSGRGTRLLSQPAPWDLNLFIEVDHGAASGLAVPGRLEAVSGTLHLINTQLHVDRLQGRLSSGTWNVQGDLTLDSNPQVDVLLRADLDLLTMATLIDPNLAPWRPNAKVNLSMICRGPLARWPDLEIMARADLQQASIRHPQFPALQLEGVAGRLVYDHLPRQLVVESLNGQVNHQPLTLTGQIRLVEPPHLTGHVRIGEAALALDLIQRADRVSIQSADLTLGASRLSGQGHLSRAPSLPSRLTASGVIHLPDLLHIPWVDLSRLEPWHVDGKADVQFRITAPFNDWPSATVTGLVRSDQLSLHEFPVQGLTAELEQAERRFWIRSVSAMVAGGKFTGEFLLLQPPDIPRYLIECNWTRADLAQVAAAVPAWKTRDLRGTISAHASLLGVRRDLSTLHGQGWLHADGERLAELPILDRLFLGVFGALADRLGLASLRKAQLVEVGGQWQVAQQRVSTQDLRLTGMSLGEPITVYTQGSVGFDQTLDLTVEPELSEQLMLKAPNVSALGGTLVRMVGRVEQLRSFVGRHHIGGTLDKPEYRFEFNLDQLLNRVLPSGIGDLLQPTR